MLHSLKRGTSMKRACIERDLDPPDDGRNPAWLYDDEELLDEDADYQHQLDQDEEAWADDREMDNLRDAQDIQEEMNRE